MSPFRALTLSLLLPVLAQAALLCPASEGTVYTPSSSSPPYTVQCGIDRPGGDLPGMPLWKPTLESCIASCSSTANCVAVVFIPGGDSNPCYLKSTLTLGVPNASHISAVEADPANGCPSLNNKWYELTADAKYKVQCKNWGFVDKDPYHNYATIAPTLVDCLRDCEKYSENYAKCRFVTFSPGFGTVPGQTVPLPGGKCAFHTEVIPGTPEHPGSVFASREALCPDLNGRYITPKDTGKRFEVECYRDRAGGDMVGVDPIWTTTGRECLETCANIKGCRGVAWHWGWPQGRCWFKGEIKEAKEDAEVWGARWINTWDFPNEV